MKASNPTPSIPRSLLRLLCAVLLSGSVLLVTGRPVLSQAGICRQTYEVLPGDTLYSIAEKCRVPYAALVGINVELRNPNNIWPGQIIRLEASVPLVKQPASGPAEQGGLQPGGVYIVRKGDSLARIAYLYQTTVGDLTALNPQVGPHGLIYPGQELQLPWDARLQRGWVGVSQTLADPGDRIEVRVVDFPSYAEIDVRIGELGYPYSKVLDATTDARGEAWIITTLPYSAWYDEVWVVEVTTTQDSEAIVVMSPAITIEGF